MRRAKAPPPSSHVSCLTSSRRQARLVSRLTSRVNPAAKPGSSHVSCLSSSRRQARSSRVSRLSSLVKPAPGPLKKKPRSLSERSEKKEPAASYSRTSERRTTLGDGALDFRVRNGNGYDSSSMATGEKPWSRRKGKGTQLAARPFEKALGRSRRA